MAYTTNNDKMLGAVLLDPELMKFGHYGEADINFTSAYQAVESDNYVISAVAHIIIRASEGATEKEIYKEITEYLKNRV